MGEDVLKGVNKPKNDDHKTSYKNILLEMIIADFAVDLIVFRKKFELTQAELAEMMSMPVDLIDKLEKGYM